MKRLFVCFILALLFAGCNKSQIPKTLEETFLLSLQKSKFEMLKPYLPDNAFYKSLGSKVPAKSDQEIKEFLEKNNGEIKAAWDKILLSASEKKLDLDKVKLKEALYYDPFTDETSEAMVLLYTYNNHEWDDLQFVVSRQKEKTYLLVIPNPTRAFSFSDSSLMASYQARINLESIKPEFKKSLGEQVSRIISSVKENNLAAFAKNLIYRGDDERRKWKSALNLNDSLEKVQAEDFMASVGRAIVGCENFQPGEINLERESEGIWIIFPANCGNKTLHFAFLKVGDKVLLGDMDAREN